MEAGAWMPSSPPDRHQTREHSDLDLVMCLHEFESVCTVVSHLGYRLAEDYLPTGAVLRNPDGQQIDLHPVAFDGDGVGWQHAALPNGQDCPYPPDGFTFGMISGRSVPCLSSHLQLAHHVGYEPRDRLHRHGGPRRGIRP